MVSSSPDVSPRCARGSRHSDLRATRITWAAGAESKLLQRPVGDDQLRALLD